jgi:hypothetical protein
LTHCDTYLLSATPPRFVASAAMIGGATIRENPEPSMGAGKVLPPASLAGAVMAWNRAAHDGVVVGGLLGSFAGGTIMRRGIVGVIPKFH